MSFEQIWYHYGSANKYLVPRKARKQPNFWCGETWYSMFGHFATIYQWVKYNFEYFLECYVRKLSNGTSFEHIWYHYGGASKDLVPRKARNQPIFGLVKLNVWCHFATLYQWVRYNFEYVLECYGRQLSDSTIQIYITVWKVTLHSKLSQHLKGSQFSWYLALFG